MLRRGPSKHCFSTPCLFLRARLETLTCHRKSKEAGDIPGTPGAVIPRELRSPFWNSRKE